MVALQGGSSGAPYKPPRAEDDPFLILQQLMQQGAGTGGGGSVDYMSQAQQMYAPQYQYLDQLTSSAQQQAKAQQAKLQQIYGALSSDILGQNKTIGSQYDSGINNVNSAYNGALQATGARFDQTNSEAEEILRRLGIEQAGANVFGKSGEAEKLLSGIIAANGGAAATNLREGKQSALTYNTNMGSAAKMAGAEAQRGVGSKLQEFLQQIGLKRADLDTQRNQTRFSLESDAAKLAQQQQNSMYDQYRDARDFEYMRAKDKADYDLKVAGMSGDKAKLDPLGEVQQLALQLYPNQQAASNAMRVLTGAVTDMGGDVPSLGALMQYIRNHLMNVNGRFGDEAQMQRLAALLWENTLDN